jgi:hypothetical protein
MTACHSLIAKPIKTKPYNPAHQTARLNNSILTSLRKENGPINWAYKQAYESSAEREAALLPWLPLQPPTTGDHMTP